MNAMTRHFAGVGLSMFFATVAISLSAQESIPTRTPKVTVTADGATAYIAQFQTDTDKIYRLKSTALAQGAEPSAEALEVVASSPAINSPDTNIVDLVYSEATQELLILCDRPPRLVRQSLATAEATTIPLFAAPARIALTDPTADAQFICVTLPSKQAVWIASLSQSAKLKEGYASLTFVPKEVIGFGESLFVVADATGNRLSLVDAQEKRAMKSLAIDGYHLAGMAIDAKATSLLVSHQVLSSNARTEQDDIRWGSLIQNNVASISLPALADGRTRLTAESLYRLGEFGHGAADPAGVVALGDRFAVAISGTDEVALYSKAQHQAAFVSVGRVPERIFKFRDDRLLCTHRLDQRIAVIDCSGDRPKLECMLGMEQPITTARQRGELAYFSGRLSHEGWMSCNSCHIDGGSPDLLVDTLGDGTYDSPKKIPTLANVMHTGPWAWHGGQFTLREQISKTLTSTMHVPDEVEAKGVARETLVDDLIAYLESFDAEPGKAATANEETTSTAKVLAKEEAIVNREREAVRAGGEALFQQHCARCHDPDQRFTTPLSYDVGINDERGQKKFNPPSLIGVRSRTKFMHDGRFSSLNQALDSHPQPSSKLTESERMQLREYLLSL